MSDSNSTDRAENAKTCPKCDLQLVHVGHYWVCPEHGVVRTQSNAIDVSSRIFLSYGHDQNRIIVEEIKRALERRGHKVWFDSTQIKSGDNWRREITEGLIHSNSHLRLIAVRTQNGALILDDTYNATPESTIAALDLLSELKGKKIAVLGDMLELGQYEEIGHESVGIRAAQIVNYLITVGPRGKIIAETAKQKGLPPTAVVSVDNALGAAELLRYNLRQGDVVLVKGSHGLHMDRISKILEGA